MQPFQGFKGASLVLGQGSAAAIALLCGLGATDSLAATPNFYSTTDAAQWQVSTNVGGADGQLSSFNTTAFQTATAIVSRPGWISNNASGTNGGIGTWTFFVFRQTFDLAGFDAATANLSFKWAADDSGEGFASRGTWVPKFSLNGGAMVPWGTGATYSFGSVVTLNSGFHAGINTLDFYVEGNGVTDGFALQTTDFSAAPVPWPGSLPLMLSGLAIIGIAARRRLSSAG